MIEYTSGDLLQADADAIVNTVNCVGVMGRGIALQFKRAFPENFEAYATACQRQEVVPGRMFVYTTGRQTNPKYIINFPTKRHWRGKSRMEDIVSGLADLQAVMRQLDIHSIAIPPLGAGLGGLKWADVRPQIHDALGHMSDVQILLYEPAGAPVSGKSALTDEVPGMTAGRAALVELISRYLKGMLDPTISLLEVHKLMYFMQEAGEPLRLRFKQAHYGPYAENLRHVLHTIEGHLVRGYADGGDAPDKALELVSGAREQADAFLSQHQETRLRLERVTELVEGFETPFGLELLSTVHWVIKQKPASSVAEIIQDVYAWNDRKRQFTPRQIGLAMDVLSQKGWTVHSA